MKELQTTGSRVSGIADAVSVPTSLSSGVYLPTSVCFVSNEAVLSVFAEIRNYPGTIATDGWCLNTKAQLLCLKTRKSLRCNLCSRAPPQDQAKAKTSQDYTHA